MRKSQSILEKIAKGFLSATILFSPNCANDGPNPTPRPPEADAVRVERVANGVACWIEGDPNTSSWQEVNELEGELRDLGEERVDYIIDFALHSHPIAAAVIGIVKEIPSVGVNFNPSMVYYLKTEDSGWTQNLTVTEGEEIVIALAYQPGEAMTNPKHHGLEAVVSKGPAGQEIGSFTLLRRNEYQNDSPNFIISDPKFVWEITDMDSAPSIPYVDRIYSIGTSPIGDNATLIVKNQQTPTPTPRPTPTPTPEPPERFSEIPAGTYVGQVTKEVYILGELAEELSSNYAYVSFEFDNFGRRMLTNTHGVRKAAEIGDTYRFGEETRKIIGAGGLENTATYTFTTSSEFFDDGDGFEVFGYDGDLKIHAEAGVVGFYDEVLDGTISKQ